MSDEEFRSRLDDHFRFRARTFWMSAAFFTAFGAGVALMLSQFFN